MCACISSLLPHISFLLHFIKVSVYDRLKRIKIGPLPQRVWEALIIREQQSFETSSPAGVRILTRSLTGTVNLEKLLDLPMPQFPCRMGWIPSTSQVRLKRFPSLKGKEKAWKHWPLNNWGRHPCSRPITSTIFPLPSISRGDIYSQYDNSGCHFLE